MPVLDPRFAPRSGLAAPLSLAAGSAASDCAALVSRMASLSGRVSAAAPGAAAGLATELWSAGERQAVFELLARHALPSSPPRAEELALLRSLPVYPRLVSPDDGEAGSRTSVDAAAGYAACPQPLLQLLPRGAAEALPPSASRLLLAHRPEWQPLYAALGLPLLDLAALLAAFVVPHLGSLSDTQQVA